MHGMELIAAVIIRLNHLNKDLYNNLITICGESIIATPLSLIFNKIIHTVIYPDIPIYPIILYANVFHIRKRSDKHTANNNIHIYLLLLSAKTFE